MHVTVITPPGAIVSTTEAKQHLRVESADEDTFIAALVSGATGMLDGPTGKLGRSLGSQTLEARFEDFDFDECEDDEIVLPFGPITSITSIKYLDEDGVEQTLATSNYQLLTDGRIVLTAAGEWPTLYADQEAVRVRYVAGYAAAPAAIKAAILLIVGFLYASREASIDDALSQGAVRALVTPYSDWPV